MEKVIIVWTERTGERGFRDSDYYSKEFSSWEDAKNYMKNNEMYQSNSFEWNSRNYIILTSFTNNFIII
jgi:hypothetical protein